jgi:hypothetical protein
MAMGHYPSFQKFSEEPKNLKDNITLELQIVVEFFFHGKFCNATKDKVAVSV